MSRKKLDILPFAGCPDEKNVTLGYVYRTFRKLLFERLMTIFIWSGLPFPSRELDYRFYKSGAVGIVKDSQAGIIAVWANLYGVTPYNDVFTNITYAAPKAKGGSKRIGEYAVVAYNDSLRSQLQSHVDLYASLLSHAYMSIKLSLINTRTQEILVAKDQQTKSNIQEWYNSLYKGKPLAIMDETLIGLNDGIINLTPQNQGSNLSDLITAYNELWRAFYRDIGIRFSKDKKSNMITSEIESDEQMLLYNIDDMLRNRIQLCEDYNKLFVDEKKWTDQKISVRLNPIFEIINNTESETESNENEEENIEE